MESSDKSSDPSRNFTGSSLDSIEITPELLSLLDLLERILNISEFDKLHLQILETANELMQVEASSLMLLDEPEENLRIIVATGPNKEEIEGTSILSDRGYAGRVVKHKKPVIVNNVELDDEIFGGELSSNFTTRNLMCVPLLDEQDKIMGVLEVLNRDNDEDFTEEDFPIIQTLAIHAARAIERIRAKKELEDVLQEHSLLLKEIHHRVKNDFALIAGIIEMERLDFNSDARAMLSKIQSRIETMSVAYNFLTDNIDSQIDVALYFRKLIKNFSRTFSNSKRNIKISVNKPDFTLGSRPALYCGLLVNELLLNAFKHAFNNVDKGEIDLHIEKKAARVTINYKDNGKGLPDNFELEHQTSHGFEIIKALVGQLEGAITVNRPSKGASFTITFKVKEETKRK